MQLHLKGFEKDIEVGESLILEYQKCLAKFVDKHPSIELPDTLTVVWNSRMRSRAGVAKYRETRIELNSRLLTENPEELIPTFIHELGHIFTSILYPKGKNFGRRIQGHGREWASVMRLLGAEPQRFHRMGVEHLKAKRRKYEVVCSCNSTYKVGIRRRNKILNGAIYRCRRCAEPVKLKETVTKEEKYEEVIS